MSFSKRILVFILLLITPADASAANRLAYYSDYFSFIGRDAGGFVAFALDNNRGVDGSSFQAEHFGVLYDEAIGWVKLVGTGDYGNPHGQLEQIPNSPSFAFQGAPGTGMVISSADNALSLRIDPVVTQLADEKEGRIQSWGVADSVLHWRDRKIRGRVIHEHLIRNDWNRLTRTYLGAWDNFQGFYLLVQAESMVTMQDLYLRSEGKSDRRRTRGFATADQWSGTIQATAFSAADKALTWGFYRWPQKWDLEIRIDSSQQAAKGRLTLQQISRRNQANWIIGGFAMAVVQGEFRINGRKMPVIGFAELIK